MKIVIEIPEDAYRQIRNWGVPTDELRRKIYDIIDNGTPLPKHHKKLLGKIKAKILDEAEYAYADFDEYKYDILHAEPDELPDDDFRYGLKRAIEIINKYKIESEVGE